MAEISKEERIKKFMEEYEALTKKYNVDFATYPLWVPSAPGTGDFKMIVQTTPVDLTEMQKAKDTKGFIAK